MIEYREHPWWPRPVDTTLIPIEEWVKIQTMIQMALAEAGFPTSPTQIKPNGLSGHSTRMWRVPGFRRAKAKACILAYESLHIEWEWFPDGKVLTG